MGHNVMHIECYNYIQHQRMLACDLVRQILHEIGRNNRLMTNPEGEDLARLEYGNM